MIVAVVVQLVELWKTHRRKHPPQHQKANPAAPCRSLRSLAFPRLTSRHLVAVPCRSLPFLGAPRLTLLSLAYQKVLLGSTWFGLVRLGRARSGLDLRLAYQKVLLGVLGEAWQTLRELGTTRLGLVWLGTETEEEEEKEEEARGGVFKQEAGGKRK